MTKFYTNFVRQGNQIFVRGYEDGIRFKEKVEYSPTLYVPSQTKTDYKTIEGYFVSPLKQSSMKDASEFIKKYEEVKNFKIYGTTNYHYAYINEAYPGEVDYDSSLIKIANIDIEVGSENGFPEPTSANEPITAITFKCDGKIKVFGLGNFNNHRDDVWYQKCKDESTLILRFLEEWERTEPDIITGWNIQFFDIPYIYNRICRLFDEKVAKRLSPWELIGERTTTISGKTQTVFELTGIATLDYIEMYKKFTYSQQESYRLDHIANIELNEKKLNYSEYESLHQLYKLNHQKFIEYNIRDVELVDRLEDKMKLIDMVLALAYDAKVNITDVFTQVRMWDTLIHNHLMNKKIVVPQKINTNKDAQYAGAYVKEPKIGMYDWVVSFDLNSLYPHLIMQYNISPDTIINGEHHSVTIDELLNYNKPYSGPHCMAANGHLFRKDIQGFLPEMMQTMYDDRSKYKRLMIEWQKKKEIAKNDDEKFECEKQISKYKNLQLAKKVQLNSAYGALGNQYFRFFDIRQAEGITLSGQLSIRWIENKLNEFMNKLMKTEYQDYVIASDTDSIYLNLGPLVSKVWSDRSAAEIVNLINKSCETKFEPFIDKSYEELANYMNAFDQKMQMKREVIADKGIWTGKKHYILNVWDSEGVRYIEPKMKIMGIEAVKSSTPSICREKIKDALKIVMKGDESELHDYIEEFKKIFYSLPFEEIAFPRGVSGLNKYKGTSNLYAKGTPIHVRGAIIYNNLLVKHNLTKRYQTIKEGEKIKFCYMKIPNTFQENVISVATVLPKEFAIEKYIDHEIQFEKAFIEPLRNVISTINWTTEPIVTLESFFK